jgi:hypothetical protein
MFTTVKQFLGSPQCIFEFACVASSWQRYSNYSKLVILFFVSALNQNILKITYPHFSNTDLSLLHDFSLKIIQSVLFAQDLAFPAMVLRGLVQWSQWCRTTPEKVNKYS